MAVSENWKLSGFEYHIDTFISPMLALTSLGIAPVTWWLLAVGWLSWTLLEYCLHRFLFHRYFRRDHWAHHVDARDYIGISGIYVTLLAAVMLIPAFLLEVTSLYTGFMLGYFSYLVSHYLIHRPELFCHFLVRRLATNHAMHHQKGVEKNFGVSTPLWDFVFLTYLNPRHS